MPDILTDLDTPTDEANELRLLRKSESHLIDECEDLKRSIRRLQSEVSFLESEVDEWRMKWRRTLGRLRVAQAARDKYRLAAIDAKKLAQKQRARR